jgi:hypothetical protein
MLARTDPRLRRALTQLTQNIENANERTQENLFSFSQNYVNPCLASVDGCIRSCTDSCFPARGDLRRRIQRNRSHGRAEASFDFYDDWEEEETDALLGLRNDEMDRLLQGPASRQPPRERVMSYGTSQKGSHQSLVLPEDNEAGKQIIISSSYFGFLDRLPFKIGAKGHKYQPSVADLQEHPSSRKAGAEEQPLIEDSDDEAILQTKRKSKRYRSGTSTSGHTTDSFSSRGDIFPSEDEMDDAVPLDDEFASQLERRTTGGNTDEQSSNKSHGFASSRSKSHLSMHTNSSRGSRGSRKRRSTSASDSQILEAPTTAHLQAEEQQIAKEEEEAVERKRVIAQRLALQRGLSGSESIPTSPRPASPISRKSGFKTPPVNGTIPFPSFNSQTDPEEQGIEDGITSQTRRSPSPERPDFVPAALPQFTSHPE